jgi:hypothetical protein
MVDLLCHADLGGFLGFQALVLQDRAQQTYSCSDRLIEGIFDFNAELLRV